jgi:hypothetical protein
MNTLGPTLPHLADEYGLDHSAAWKIAKKQIRELAHYNHKTPLKSWMAAQLRPLFLAARPAPRPPQALGFAFEEDKPMTMTVKEVAEALGVHIDTVNSWVKKLYPDLPRNGVPTLLNEAQVTEIKQSIEHSGRSDLRNVPQLQNIQTELEIADITAKILGYWQGRAASLKTELAGKTEALALAAPKVEAFDRFLDASGTLCIMDVAKQLGRLEGGVARFGDTYHGRATETQPHRGTFPQTGRYPSRKR